MIEAMDDRDGKIWLDGQMVEWREARPHVLSHALHYSSSVFEGERAYGGHVFRLRQHSARLKRSAELLDFEIPWTVEQIDAATGAVVAANDIVDGYIRPIAWRGTNNALGVSAAGTSVHLAIAAWSWPEYFSAHAKLQGIRLSWAEWKRPAPDTAPWQSKAAGLYMIATLAKDRALKAGFDDALMLDWRGHVAEATGANVFLVIDGALHTPAADCFLAGITRQTVIELARARGIEVHERAILPEELAQAQEMFLTGTAAEITPVRELANHRFQVGQVTRQLMDDFAMLVRSEPARDGAQQAA
ncbi:MAG: branched-chain amino acid aminotransferase [Rhodospirillales bacterium]